MRPQLEIEPAFGDRNNNCVLVRIDVLGPYSDDVDSSTRADIEFKIVVAGGKRLSAEGSQGQGDGMIHLQSAYAGLP